MKALKTLVPVVLWKRNVACSASADRHAAHCHGLLLSCALSLRAANRCVVFLPSAVAFHTPAEQDMSCDQWAHLEPGSGDSVTAAVLKHSFEVEKISFVSGHACYRVICPVCASKPRTLAPTSLTSSCGAGVVTALMNKNTGHWLCEFCYTRGTWSSYLSLRSSTKAGLKLCRVEAGRRRKDEDCQLRAILAGAVPLTSLGAPKRASLLKAVKLTHICPQTLEALDCHVIKEKQSLLFPIKASDGGLLAVRGLVPNEDTDRAGQSMEMVFPSGSVVPFGSDHESSEISGNIVVVTSTLHDALAIYDRTGLPAVSLPCGMHRVPPDCLFWLEKWNKAIVWFGSDPQSWPAVRALAQKLGESRCYYVNPAQWNWGPYKALGFKANLSKIISEARAMSHKDIATFPNLRQHVKAELTLVDQVRGVKWKRFKGLNKILRGHRRGELTVLTGQTGTGKTTLMSEYSLDLCLSGVATLWGSFEVQPVRLAKVMLMQFAGVDLEQHLDQFDRWADDFERLPMYFTTLHGRTGLTQVLDAMSHAVYIHDIHHVVLDNLQFMLGDGGLDRFAKQDQAIGAFRKFATSHNCHVSLVIHPRKEGYADNDQLTVASIFGGAKASQEADNVLILQDRRLKVGSSRKKYLQVAKNRFSGDLGIVPLDFDKSSRSFTVKTRLVPARLGTESHASVVLSSAPTPESLPSPDS